ncbi:hypothetical protein MVG78_17605 [Roseomonas gilardii subsp. gilardii]|uniref:hypothetical protein n=1 Tax=Roseomonas gilardii TaxID=257708 RepID=UPI001FF9E6A7|nr:hypothetical protein [Roseomonas gilardii]UPG72301.1 hypothetical protein MVG78_17605 [Roseomonas gilardii subsp. gilardii]
MARIVSGLFDRREDVELVIEHLVQQDGLDRRRIAVHATDGADAVAEEGFWASLRHLFMPDEDRHAYSEGIRRGGIVLTAEVEEGEADHAIAVFRDHGAADLEDRRREWRGAGWQDYVPQGETGGLSPAEMAALAAATAGTPDPADLGAPTRREGREDEDIEGTAALNPLTGTRVPLVVEKKSGLR